MDQKSRQKVINAGFSIIRKDDYPNIRIKILDNQNPDWRTLEKFETKAARDRRFEEFNNLQMIISD